MLALSDMQDLFSYKRDTGLLVWKKCANPAWNGKIAGNINNEGYRQISINDRLMKAHRVVWALHYGEWPSTTIDHVNGNRSDNRIDNLRLATAAENSRNREKSKNNRSGYPGVSWRKDKQMWRATIQSAGRKIHLGYFPDPSAAHAAYLLASQRLFGDFHRSELTA